MSEEWNWFDSLPGDAQEQIVTVCVAAGTVANGSPEGSMWECPWCGECVRGAEPHPPVCPITKLREALAAFR